MRIFLLITIFISLSYLTSAQFSLYNLAEVQYGNIPGTEPEDLFTTYDQLNVQYRLKNFRTSAKIESFYKSIDKDDNYSRLSQFLLNYRSRELEFNIGNFYTTFGKGLLLRGYEIKNSVFEDQIYRVRQGFYKDIKGISAGYHNRYFSVKALTGKMLNNQLPPFSDEKRLDKVHAGETRINFAGQSAGIIYLNNQNPTLNTEYLSGLIEGILLKNISYYGEYAYRLNNEGNYLGFTEGDSYGLYLNINYTIPGFGISLEYKDYQNFLIGSGLADPPTLIKEHSYRLLNRSTHVTELFDESGFQAEIFYNISENNFLTLNYSKAVNEIGNKFRFREVFAELNSTLSTISNLKVFADYASDELKFEDQRYATGLNYQRRLNDRNLSFSAEFEIQHVIRNIDFQKKYTNVYGGLIISNSTKFSASLIWEFTNDKITADLPNTEKVETKRHYPGINILFKPNNKNTFQLFAGERRGGPACTSGICYEILDFKGIELRYSIRL